MVVITEAGMATCLGWWAQLRVEGKSVVVATSPEERWPESSLVVAELRSEGEAQAMFRSINQRILLKARTFDSREWPGSIRREGNDAAGGRNR
jgi:hypothetical protein